MTISEQLKNAIAESLKKLGAENVNFTLEHPADLSHGDFATNVAMVAYGEFQNQEKKAYFLEKRKQVFFTRAGEFNFSNPRELAENIKKLIEEINIPELESMEVAGPGFINFKLSPEFFADLNKSVLNEGAGFGKSDIHSGKKILIEHSSPNLFKPFHIGHMMNNAIGESLVRLMRFSGADVRTMSFPSDISIGIAKAIFIIIEKYGADFSPNDISVLGDAYVEGTKRFEEDESIHARVKEIADNLYAKKDSSELEIFEKCKKFNIEYFESVTEKLGSHFDSYIYESEAGEIGKKIVLENVPNVFTESEGAVVYVPDESKKGLNTLVFVNSQGNPTYEAKDIGLLDLKFERENPDLSIFITDNEQIPHFNVVLDAASQIEPKWSERSRHIPHGRMTFKGQKMSSRLGGVPLALEMIDLVSEEARERAKDREQVDQSESIAIAAIKFAILRAKPGQNINFDPETSLSFEGDSGPYLQYTHARISSLIEKANVLGILPVYGKTDAVTDVEKTILQFPTVVEQAIKEFAPQLVVTYLLELARSFNSFYGANKIVDEGDKETSAHRLAIAKSVQIVLKNGLSLLGISAPDRM